MLQRATAGDAHVLSMVGWRRLYSETAVFRSVIGEVAAKKYNTTFKKLAELALDQDKRSPKLAIVKTGLEELPEFLLLNQVAISLLADSKSLDEIKNGQNAGRISAYSPGLVPMPVDKSYFSLSLHGSRHVYVAASGSESVQVWDSSEAGILIRADWQNAFKLLQTSVDYDNNWGNSIDIG